VTLAADPFTDALRLAAQACVAELREADPEASRTPDDVAALTDPVTLAAHLDPGYRVRAHLRVIGDEYAKLLAAYRDYDRTRRPARLLINTPPQCGKTVSAVEWAAFWWLALHPEQRIIIGCYNSDLAVDRGTAVRKLVLLYGDRYGLRLEPGSSAKKDWRLTTGGGVLSVGVAAGVTGKPANLIIIDDPTKSRAEADSPTYRKAVADWYSADLMTRRSPACPVVLVQTPWNPADLRAQVLAQDGRVEDGGRWRLVVMPALCTDPANDPLGRAEGDPLPHPGVRDGDRDALLAHWAEQRATSVVRDWVALYQCDPQPQEGTLLAGDVLVRQRCYTSRPTTCATPVRVAVAVDPSGGGRDTAGVVGGYLGDDGRLYLTHDRSGVMSSEAWARAACELAADTNADLILGEVNYGGDMVTLSIRTAWDALRREQPDRFGVICPRVVAVRAKRGKVLRAEPIAQQWQEDRIRTAAFLPELESEWASWMPGPESPGRIDASVYLAYELLPVPQSGVTTAVGAGALANTNLLPWGR
jgi:hypothetical protein